MKGDGNMSFEKRTAENSVAKIVAERLGYTLQELEQEISGKVKHTLDIPNIQEAVDLFWECKDGPIRVYGDFDCDGIMSCAILEMGFRNLGVKDVTVTVPRRFSDGYGVKPANVCDMKSGLLITVDNGIAANEAITQAKENGVKVIVLDHHQGRMLDGKLFLPDADVIVDPHITGGEFQDYCGAGLAYRFMRQIFATKCRPKNVNSLLAAMITMAAIATVGDHVSITSENRFMVRKGLEQMKIRNVSTGLHELLDVMNLEGDITASDIAFTLAPAINAYGRLEDKGSRKVESMLQWDGRNSEKLRNAAEIIKQKNNERKELSKRSTALAFDMIEQMKQDDKSFIVLQNDSFHPGLCGIIASNITDNYKIPCTVFAKAKDGDIHVGSGRSREWCDLKKTLDKCAELLWQYGGHPGACGLSIKTENIDSFREKVQSIVEKVEEPDTGILYYDIDANIHTADKLYKEIQKYGPYGVDNEELVVRFKNLNLIANNYGETEKTMGQIGEHIRLFAEGMEVSWFEKEGGTKAYREIGSPKKVDVIGTLSLNTFRGKSKLVLKVKDMVSLEENSNLNDKIKNL